MPGAWTAFMRNINVLWRTGDLWIRVAILSFGWPIVMNFVAHVFPAEIARVINLVPVLGFLVAMLTTISPTLTALISAIDRRLTGIVGWIISLSVVYGIFGLFVVECPMNFNQMLLLYSGFLFWAINAKLGSRNGLISVISCLIIIFSLGWAMTGKTTIGTIFSRTGDLVAHELSSMENGSSAEDPIVLSSNPENDPIQIPTGSDGWFKVEPNEWTQWVTCPYGYRFNLISLTNTVQVKCYINPPGDGPSDEVIRVAGPGEPLDWPMHVTKLSFYAEKTALANIGVLKNKKTR